MQAYSVGVGLAGLSDFLHSEYDPTYTTSKRAVLAGSGSTRVLAALCLVAISLSGATVTVTPGSIVGTGDGAIGTVTADGNVMAGRWFVYNAEPVSDSGKLQVIRPDGTIDGFATIGSAYNGGLNFTWADGSTDLGAGGYIPIDVTYDPSAGKLVQWDPTATDGAQVIVGVNCFYAQALDGVDGPPAPYLARGPLIGRREALVWHSGATTDQKNAAYRRLADLGIQCRQTG